MVIKIILILVAYNVKSFTVISIDSLIVYGNSDYI